MLVRLACCCIIRLLDVGGHITASLKGKRERSHSSCVEFLFSWCLSLFLFVRKFVKFPKTGKAFLTTEKGRL